MSRFSIAVSLLALIFLTGCVTNSKPYWQVKTGERSTLAFSGKGAAAGIAVDSYISGAGAAIGVAIDEGIAKAIGENLQKKSPAFSFNSLVGQQLAKQSGDLRKLNCSEGALQVVVDTYGFRTFVGRDDDVTAWIRIHFICNGKDTLINYPADFPAPKLAELKDVKSNPDVAYSLLNDAVAEVLLAWNKDLK